MLCWGQGSRIRRLIWRTADLLQLSEDGIDGVESGSHDCRKRSLRTLLSSQASIQLANEVAFSVSVLTAENAV